MSHAMAPSTQFPGEHGHGSPLNAGDKIHSSVATQDLVTARSDMQNDRNDPDRDVSPLTLPPPRYPRAGKASTDQSKSFPFRPDLAPFIPQPIMKSRTSDVEMSSEFNINQQPPFLSPVINLGLQTYSVLRLSNIPYGVTISEIKHLVKGMSEHALIEDHHQGFAVHIVMERSTGKTMECYVELQHNGAAQDLVSKADLRYSRGKAIKIGSRHIHFAVSSQGELAAALFPRAKSCLWNPVTGAPEIHDSNDPYSEGFQGFFTIEEMANIVKLAEVPQRSQFSNRSHQRPYESMISILYKFPWASTYHYTVNARNLLFTAYMHLLRLLVEKVPPMTDLSNFHHIRPQAERQVGINHALLMDFLFAGLNTPCFSLRQKCFVVSNAGPIGSGFPLEFHAAEWPFQALSLPPKFPDKLLTTWLRIFKIGYHVMKSTNDIYGVEEFINLAYDDSGCPIFDLTDAGRSLHFEELIAVERDLMEKIVDKGRAKWCFDNCVFYAPIKSCEPFSFAYMVEPVQQAMQAFQMSDMIATEGHKSHDPALECNQRPMHASVLTRALPRSHTEVEQTSSAGYHHRVRQVHHLRPEVYDDNQQVSQFTSQKTVTKALGSRDFNPATPPFVPSQQWSNPSHDKSQDTQAPANAPRAPRSHSVGNAPPAYAQVPGPMATDSIDSVISPQAGASIQEHNSTNVGLSRKSTNSATPGRLSSTSRHPPSDDPFSGPHWSSSPWTSTGSRPMSSDRAHVSSLGAHRSSDTNTTASQSHNESTAHRNTAVMNLTIREEKNTGIDKQRSNETGGTGLAQD